MEPELTYADLSAEAAELGAIADADLTDEQLDRLEALPALMQAARASEARAALSAVEADPEDDDADSDEDDADSDEDDAADDEAEALVASAVVPAPRKRGPAPAANAPRRVTQKADLLVAEPKLPMFAAANVRGYAVGAQIEMLDVAKAITRTASSLKGRPKATANYSMAQIRKEFDSRAIVSGDNAEAAITFASDETRLKGGSLVAAGGWCAPSETLYDLSELETVSGIISLPEIQAARGGLNSTIGPVFADLYADTGFCFTEAQDEAGNYSLTSAVQTATEGGAGLTSYTITVNGQTTASIDDDATAATVQLALEALSNVAPGDVTVTGTANPIAMQYTWGGALAGTNVVVSSTPTGGSGTVVIASVVPGGAAGGEKPCYHVECPDFSEVRLGVCGVCITAGYLQNRAYPELTARVVRGALVAHEHRVAAAVIANIVAGSTAVTITDVQNAPGAAAPLLDAIELQATHMRYVNRMDPNASLEVILPVWGRGVIRADLSRRLGVDLVSVTDADIDGYFRDRKVAVQWVYNFQDFTGSPASRTLWPTTIAFLMYPAGTWVKMVSDVIDLGVVHDSSLFAVNDYTALFTEEGWNTLKRNASSVVVTVTICPNGATQAGLELVCASDDPA